MAEHRQLRAVSSIVLGDVTVNATAAAAGPGGAIGGAVGTTGGGSVEAASSGVRVAGGSVGGANGAAGGGMGGAQIGEPLIRGRRSEGSARAIATFRSAMSVLRTLATTSARDNSHAREAVSIEPMQTLALIVAIVLGARASARAEKVIPFISGGLSIGAALHPDRDNGFLVGGELSAGGLLAYQKDNPGAETTSTGPPVWFGVYIDVLRDYGSNTTRVSFGPEVGWRVIGLDGGIVRELGDDAAWGCAIRPSFTVGPLSAYVRYTRFSSDAPESSHVEVGLLVKLPYAPGLKLF